MDEWNGCLQLVIVLVVGIIMCWVFMFALPIRECGDFGRQIEYPTKWSLWSGCYVQIDDAWVPSGNFWQYVRIEQYGGN